MVPPWPSTISLQMARPRPLPPCSPFVVENGSRRVSDLSAGHAPPGVSNFHDGVRGLSSHVDKDALVFDLILWNPLNGVDQEIQENLTEAGFVAEHFHARITRTNQVDSRG